MDSVGGHPPAAGKRRCCENMAHSAGGRNPTLGELAQRRQLEGRREPLVKKRPVAENTVDDAKVAGARNIKPQADRPAPVDNICPLDHLHGSGIGTVVDAGEATVLENRAQVIAKRLLAAVPQSTLGNDIEVLARLKTQ